MSDLANLDYLARVNRAIDHVTQNLAEPLSLEDVAKVACFSPYHFHRIFRAITGETLHDFVKRLRLERALYLISHSSERTLTEVALACGFSSSSDFSRSFRARFGVAPSVLDVDVFRRSRRERLIDTLPKPLELPTDANPDQFKVKIRDLPERRVAYLRVFRPYEPGRVKDAAAKMIAWAQRRGLAGGQWLGYQWDDPELVDLELCRYDIGVEIPESAVIDAEVNEIRFPAMKVAEVEIKGSVELELRGLYWLYGSWLPRSGFAPDHQPGFEAFIGEPFAHGDEYFEVNMHLAIV